MAEMAECVVYSVMVVVLAEPVEVVAVVAIETDEIEMQEIGMVWARTAVDAPLVCYTRDNVRLPLVRLLRKNHNSSFTCLRLYNVIVYLDERRGIQ